MNIGNQGIKWKNLIGKWISIFGLKKKYF